MTGVKGRSGRRKALGKQIDVAMKLLDAELPDLITRLISKAEEGDREALIYLIDRRLGRPKQEIDQRVRGEILITPDMRALAAREMIETREEEAKLLARDDDAKVQDME